MTNSEYFDCLTAQTHAKRKDLSEMLFKIEKLKYQPDEADLKAIGERQAEVLRLLKQSQKFLRTIIRLNIDLKDPYRPELFLTD